MLYQKSRRCTHNENDKPRYNQKVKVEKVQTVRTMGKTKRIGVHVGKRADQKKAIVTLAKDSKAIEFFEGMQ